MKRNINAIIEKCNCVEVQPTVYREGSEWYKVLAANKKDITKLFGELSDSSDYKVLSRTNVPMGPMEPGSTIQIGGLFGQLTSKQISVLDFALTHGYYMTPRRVRASELAEFSKIPRTSFEEHRRKAECKVMSYLLRAYPKN